MIMNIRRNVLYLCSTVNSDFLVRQVFKLFAVSFQWQPEQNEVNTALWDGHHVRNGAECPHSGAVNLLSSCYRRATASLPSDFWQAETRSETKPCSIPQQTLRSVSQSDPWLKRRLTENHRVQQAHFIYQPGRAKRGLAVTTLRAIDKPFCSCELTFVRIFLRVLSFQSVAVWINIRLHTYGSWKMD